MESPTNYLKDVFDFFHDDEIVNISKANQDVILTVSCSPFIYNESIEVERVFVILKNPKMFTFHEILDDNKFQMNDELIKLSPMKLSIATSTLIDEVLHIWVNGLDNRCEYFGGKFIIDCRIFKILLHSSIEITLEELRLKCKNK